MKAIAAFLIEFSPPVAVVVVQPQVFVSPAAIQGQRELLSKSVELQGHRLVLAAQNAVCEPRFDGDDDLKTYLYRAGWARIPWQEVELTFSS